MTSAAQRILIAIALLGFGPSSFGSLRGNSPVIDTVFPTTGSIGAELTITGSDFSSKPVVWLNDGNTPKKYPLKVLSFTETTIQAVVMNAAVGLLDLHVKVKGDTAFKNDAFGGVLGELGTLSTPTPVPGATVNLLGTGFGTLKGKVTASGKVCPVVSWTNTQIDFKLPALGIGERTIGVKNKLGNATGSLTILSPSLAIKPKGASGVDFFGNGALSQFSSETVAESYSFLNHEGTITASLLADGPIPARVLSFTIPFHLTNDTAPKTLSIAQGLDISWTQTPTGGSATRWDQTGIGATATMIVTSEIGSEQTGSVIAGTISGTLIRASGTADPAVLPFQIAFRSNL